MSHNIHTKSALQRRIQNIWTRSITYHIKNKFSSVIYYKKTKTKPPLPPKKENKKRKTILDFDILPVPIFSSSITYCSNLVQLSLISTILSYGYNIRFYSLRWGKKNATRFLSKQYADKLFSYELLSSITQISIHWLHVRFETASCIYESRFYLVAQKYILHYPKLRICAKKGLTS